MRRCKICVLEDVMGAGVVVELIRLGQGLSNTPHLHLCLRGCDASVLLSPAHLKDNAFALSSRWIIWCEYRGCDYIEVRREIVMIVLAINGWMDWGQCGRIIVRLFDTNMLLLIKLMISDGKARNFRRYNVKELLLEMDPNSSKVTWPMSVVQPWPRRRRRLCIWMVELNRRIAREQHFHFWT